VLDGCQLSHFPTFLYYEHHPWPTQAFSCQPLDTHSTCFYLSLYPLAPQHVIPCQPILSHTYLYALHAPTILVVLPPCHAHSPKQSNNSAIRFLSLNVTPHIHLIIYIVFSVVSNLLIIIYLQYHCITAVYQNTLNTVYFSLNLKYNQWKFKEEL